MRIAEILDAQRGALFPWSPVFFGAGIGTYFALRFEPEPPHWAGIAVLAALVFAGVWHYRLRAPILIAIGLVIAGFGVAAYRTHAVAEPVLGFRYYGPVDGRVVAIDRSASDKVRITLDNVVLLRVSPERTPARVRVSLHGQQGFVVLEPGLRVGMTAHLSPPGGPVEPGGFDFRRLAWFQKLGAVGYTRTPVIALEPADAGKAGLLVHRARQKLSLAVQSALPGRVGAFAAAITTGDRSAMNDETVQALRDSNLAHLLAISGLHMGLLTGFVYAAVRYGLAFTPVALRWPTHKIGAVAAFLCGAVYLALSGGNVATERAFIMVSAMLCAILFDRRALTIRSVAFAAMIVLALRPEVLTGPGFQMSFAATAALIAVFAALRDTSVWRWHPALRWFLALAVSSAVAGLATAPFAAAHFNRVPHFGLIANLLSVPVMGAIVIPGAVVAALLAPVGLAIVGLTMMRVGIEWILAVADWVASFDGAVSAVPSPSAAVLPILTFACLWIIIWQGRARWFGAAPCALALALWIASDRPDILVSEDGALIGILAAEGRDLSKAKGGGFAADNWLQNDGDTATQAEAFDRTTISGDSGLLKADLGTWSLHHVSGRGAADRIAAACAGADAVITTAKDAAAPKGCDLYDSVRLRDTGSLAIHRDGDGIRIVSARDLTGERPWNRRR